jgi:Right handed beta helix region
MRAQATFALTAAALVSVLATAPAHAARQHTFVASYGNDSNVCSFLSPCATFQYALSQTVSGGEITAIDSDGFGPLNITQSVTITGAPGAEANVPPVTGGSSVAINGNGSGINVTLRNLTINGEGVGYNGIEIDQAASVTVINCTITDFYQPTNNLNAGNGIWISMYSQTGNLTVTNSVLSNNGQAGIYIGAATNALIDNVVVTGNAVYGIYDFEGGDTTVAIANSFISQNGTGVFLEAFSTTISIDNTVVTGNGIGIDAYPYGTPYMHVLLGRSVVTGNTRYGVYNQTTSFGGANEFFSYDDNRINSNGTGTADDEFGTALNTTTYVKR